MSCVRFGAFQLDVRGHVLSKDAQPIPLQHKPFAFLLALIERPGDLVTREELRRRLWPTQSYGQFDDGLNTVVRKVRAALGDSATHPRFVETVPGLGYRFIAPVSSDGAMSPSSVSLLVQPFVPVGEGVDMDSLCDGLTEEVMARLAGVRALRVIARTTALRFRGTEKGARAIGTKLGVRYVVSGTVQYVGQEAHVRTEISDTLTDTTVWAGSVSAPMARSYDLQEQVTRAVVEALRVALTPEEEQKLAARPIADPTAYEAYRRAHQAMLALSHPDAQRAQAYLAQAEALIGEHPLLLVARGEMEWMYANLEANAARGAAAEQAFRRAVELDPESSPALMGMAWICGGRGRLAESLAYVSRALHAKPTHGTDLVYAGVLAWMTGRWDEARVLVESAARVDPLHHWLLGLRALLAAHDRQPGEVDQYFGMATHLEPEQTGLWLLWLLTHLRSGQHERAHAVIGRGHRPLPGDPFGRVFLASCAAAQGRLVEARQLLDLAVLDPLLDNMQWGWHIASALALSGLSDDAMTVLGRAVAHGFWNADLLEREDCTLEPLRARSEFHALVATAREGQAALDEVRRTYPLPETLMPPEHA